MALPHLHGLKETLKIRGLDFSSPQPHSPQRGSGVGGGGKTLHLLQDDKVILCRSALVNLLFISERKEALSGPSSPGGHRGLRALPASSADSRLLVLSFSSRPMPLQCITFQVQVRPGFSTGLTEGRAWNQLDVQ